MHRQKVLSERNNNPPEHIRVCSLQLCYGKKRFRIHEEYKRTNKAVSDNSRAQDSLQIIPIGKESNYFRTQTLFRNSLSIKSSLTSMKGTIQNMMISHKENCGKD